MPFGMSAHMPPATRPVVSNAWTAQELTRHSWQQQGCARQTHRPLSQRASLKSTKSQRVGWATILCLFFCLSTHQWWVIALRCWTCRSVATNHAMEARCVMVARTPSVSASWAEIGRKLRTRRPRLLCTAAVLLGALVQLMGSICLSGSLGEWTMS